MKYVSLDMTPNSGGLTKRLVFAFPNDIVHKDMADSMTRLLQVDGAEVSVHAAGEINANANATFGSSVSLGGLQADPDDARLFLMQDYGGNYL